MESPHSQLHSNVVQLTEALEHRTIIGQALGLLMERFDIKANEAFSFLVRCSSHQNRRLYDNAVEFVETRELPHSGPSTMPDDVPSA